MIKQCSCRVGSNYIVTCKYLVSTGYKQSKKGGKDQESQVKSVEKELKVLMEERILVY